ncbi:hypothetical protein [Ottowia sp.]|uniref:hypothetical protein n=1 Tax=Ottowia sp. TaxID=1898956 RepID=UPI0026307613|nr:hypothetical protein [Ottowia sp.]
MTDPHTALYSPLKTRLQLASCAMMWGCRLLLLVLPVALATYWCSASDAALVLGAHLPTNAVAQPLADWQRIVAALIAAVPLALLLFGLRQAGRCFQMFSRGQVFTLQAARLLGSFAAWVAWAALASLLADSAISSLLTLGNPPAQRHLSVAIGSEQLLLLFFAGMVWLMASVITQGHSLAEDNEGFV